MSSSRLFRFAGWSTYFSAGATLVGFITLIVFFIVSDPYGIINDISSIVIALSALPILFALLQLHRPSASTAGLLAFGIGGLAALNAAIFQAIFVVTRKTYGDTVTMSYGFFGVALTYVGGVISIVTYPTWAVWLGRFFFSMGRGA